MNDFDEKARAWDLNPMNAERSAAIAENMLRRIEVRPNMKALDFGAGTGILSFMLADKFSRITMMDSSLGMVQVMQEKVAKSNVTNLIPIHHDLLKESVDAETFDLIFTQLVLHHISDIDDILARFYQLIQPGGNLAIADLYAEDGSFHSEGFEGHFGFDPDLLSSKLERAGFHSVSTETCFSVSKMTAKGEKVFPIFLMIATR
jgi:2-polyprenyl-3-methyl-5-hydroxy-6-metoxy-1,4-benzoquinol methylase